MFQRIKLWATGKFARLVGPSFLTRAVTTIGGVIIGAIGALNLDLPEGTLENFSVSLNEILNAGGVVLTALALDALFSKKDSK